jgi:CBS domain containing-hemolysin-like protein
MTTAALTVGLVLILGAAWLRAAGSAVARIPRADALRDASDGVKGAGEIATLLDDRETISPAVGVVGAALLVMGAALGAVFLAGNVTSYALLLVAIGVGLLVFLLGELIPRRLGMINPRFIAYHSHRLLRAAVMLGGWANELIPEIEGDEEEPDEFVDEEAEEQER